jgi:hypothetical protein
MELGTRFETDEPGEPHVATLSESHSMKHVLSVGQCGFDHGSISRFLHDHFDVEITPAPTASVATDLLRKQPFDLVLVNRQLDADGTEGLDFVQALKADPVLATKPVMLVTNFPEYDKQAVALGAVSGFGKAAIGLPDVVRRLEPFLK